MSRRRKLKRAKSRSRAVKEQLFATTQSFLLLGVLNAFLSTPWVVDNTITLRPVFLYKSWEAHLSLA